MDILKRTLAPITLEAWAEIDNQARLTLISLLSGRKIVDVKGPLGWDYAAVPLGRLEVPSGQDMDEVRYGIHKVLPLLELEAAFELNIWEVDNIVRGAQNIDLSALEAAAAKVANFEEQAIYYGFEKSGIVGLKDATHHTGFSMEDNPQSILEGVTRGITSFIQHSIEGPYSLVVNPEIWMHLSTYVSGYPLKKHLEEQLGGSVILSPTIKDAFLVSTRGGDMQLTLGQDIGIGYRRHDKHNVSLYFTESFTFQVLVPEAIIYYSWKK